MVFEGVGRVLEVHEQPRRRGVCNSILSLQFFFFLLSFSVRLCASDESLSFRLFALTHRHTGVSENEFHRLKLTGA